jgi:hypothetical protein
VNAVKPSIPLPSAGSSPFEGPGLSRRAFVRLGSGGLVASWFLRSPASAFAATSGGVTPRGSAKNCVYVRLGGAPSQVDTFDLKEGAWTPSDFAPTSYLAGNARFPQGLMPKLADRLGDVVLVRSCMAWALVHGLADTWSQIARNPASALGAVAPNVGAIAALELEKLRNPATDLLPTFLSLNASPIGAGYLPSRYAPFSLQPSPGGIGVVEHPEGDARFKTRWNDLAALDLSHRSGSSPLGKVVDDYAGFYDQARVLVESPDVGKLFSFTKDELAPYGETTFGASCLVARKVLVGRRGARFIQLALDGWDHHSGIYAKGGGGIFGTCAELDPALATLLAELKAAPGETPGKSLLDETLVVVAGEFGRTTGALTSIGGRDHGFRYTTLLAGGGVKGGRVIGKTDAAGDLLVEPGWSAGRDVRPEDVAATIYSALGIDWTTERYDDPFGRGFEYIPYAKDGTYKPVDEVFG